MTRSSLSPLARYIKLGPVIALFFLLFATRTCSGAYFGKLIGKLSELHHGVTGEVYAVDGRTLFIKDFTYDGEGPAAYFYVGNSKAPNGNGFRLRNEHGTTDVLKRYRRKAITLTLPEGKTLNNIKWFSVWCDEFSVNFGDVKIPRGFDYPRPQKLAALNGVHGVSSEPVVIVDAQTLLIPSFSYDGEAPDAKFWVGTGPTPSPQGIRVPDENGKEQPLRRYDRKTIVLTLPADLTVHQLGHFGVWCEAFTVDFGHVQIPQGLNVPPSLKMLGISPQSKLNCEVLEDNSAFEVRWAVAGDSIVIQLVGKLDAREYMSFGLSADPERSIMIGGDVAVAWVDKQTLQGYAIDYFLDAKSQCSGGRGSCPDTRIQENTNSIRLLNAAMVNGYSIVTYQRPLKASDELDLQIRTNGSQAIIWAIGPLNQRNEVSFHSSYLKTDRFIDFARPPVWNCPMPDQNQDHAYEDNDKKESNHQELAVTTRRPSRVPAAPASAPKNEAWDIPSIQCYEPEDGVFYAQMGPTGGKHGYPAITGHVGWGISWYINGLLIPEINVVRGQKYTFVVEGGVDPETPARYHPFYITDDPIGGYQHKTPEEKSAVKIFAGVRRQRGTVTPTGVGRLCNWVPDQNQPPADEFASFGAYQRTLALECDHGEPGIVEWTPDKNTPDTVYYQCFTHRYLGWKINVHDSCDTAEEAASEIRETFAKSDTSKDPEDLDEDASIRVSSKVTPGPEFFQQHREYSLRHPSLVTNPTIGKLSSHTQLTRSNVPHLIDSYERFQSFEDHAPRSTYPAPAAIAHEDRKHAHHTLLTHNEKRYRPDNIRGTQSLGGPGTATSNEAGYEVMESDREIHRSNQESKLVTDSRAGMIYGTKMSYPRGAPIYSRAPQHAAHQKTQLMILRRPVQKRRPMLTSMILPGPAISLPTSRVPSTLMERKKQHFDNPSLRFVPNKQANLPQHQQTTKLIKLNARHAEAAETRISHEDVAPSEVAYASMSTTQVTQGPPRNAGFKPESVVVERGFEPIITSLDLDVAEDKSLEPREENSLPEGLEYRPIDNFEPMFVPSPPDRNRNKKLKKKAQVGWTKTRLDDVDDMEMAADRLDARYLPPATIVPKRTDESSIGTLVTYDGKTVLDSSLAKTIPRVNERPRSRVSSDLLSRTPQFGRFRGELPPPIPGDVRAENIPQLSSQHAERRIVPEELATSVYSQPRQGGNTKLTLVEREKRSSHSDEAMDNVSVRNNASWTSHHDGHVHDRFTLVSAGETIVSNIGYILLTVVLYFVI